MRRFPSFIPDCRGCARGQRQACSAAGNRSSVGRSGGARSRSGASSNTASRAFVTILSLPVCRSLQRCLVPLEFGEFFKPRRSLTPKKCGGRGPGARGQERADAINRGSAPLTAAKCPRSTVLHSRTGWLCPPPTRRWRCPMAGGSTHGFHGRNEALSEGNFLYDREHNPGEFTSANTIVLHLYGAPSWPARWTCQVVNREEIRRSLLEHETVGS